MPKPRKRARNQRAPQIPHGNVNVPQADQGNSAGVAVQMPSRPMGYVTKPVVKVLIKEEIKRTYSDGTVGVSVETYPAFQTVWE